MATDAAALEDGLDGRRYHRPRLVLGLSDGRARVEGIVIMEATTDAYGRVASVKVLRSIPLLDQAAIDAVRQWIYEPLVIEGKARPAVFTVTVRFELK